MNFGNLGNFGVVWGTGEAWRILGAYPHPYLSPCAQGEGLVPRDSVEDGAVPSGGFRLPLFAFRLDKRDDQHPSRVLVR